MALAASTVWEVQPGTGNDANGGGFNVGNANFATDLSATSALTSTPVVTSASYTFVARDVGALLFVRRTISSFIPGWYSITSVSAGAATINAAIGAVILYGAPGKNTSVGCSTSSSTVAGSTWSIDYSQSASPGVTFSDLVIGATNTQITSAANPMGKNFVGNILNVTSGTNFTVQRLEIFSVSGTTATCDKAVGTAASTGGNGKLGGCFATPQAALNVGVASNKVFVKATATASTSTGLSFPAGWANTSPSNTVPLNRLIGYSSYRGDAGQPTLQASASSVTILTCAVNGTLIENFIIDGNSQTTSAGVNFTTSGNMLRNCKIMNTTAAAFSNSGGTMSFLEDCEITACGFASGVITPSSDLMISRCYIHGNTSLVINVTTSVLHVYNCIIASNSGASSTAIGGTPTFLYVMRNVIDSNGLSGISISGTKFFSSQIINNIISNHTAGSAAGLKLFTATGFPASPMYDGNFYYNNTLNRFACDEAGVLGGVSAVNGIGTYLNVNDVVLTADPYTNRAGGDYTLNNKVGGGADVRGQGYPATLPGATGTSYSDGGFFQHQDQAMLVVHKRKVR